MAKSRPVLFKWRQSEPEDILMAVGWVLERGLDTDHVTVWRWVQRYAPELERRLRAHLKPREQDLACRRNARCE